MSRDESTAGLREALAFLQDCREAMLEAGTWEEPMPDYWATYELICEIARRESRTVHEVIAEFQERR